AAGRSIHARFGNAAEHGALGQLVDAFIQGGGGPELLLDGLDLTENALLVDPLGEEDVPGAERHDRQNDQDAARNDRTGGPDVAETIRRGLVGSGSSASGLVAGSGSIGSRSGRGSSVSGRGGRSSGIGSRGGRGSSVSGRGGRSVLGRSRSRNAQAGHKDDSGCDRQGLEVHFLTPRISR